MRRRMAASINVMVTSSKKRRCLAHAGMVGEIFFCIEHAWHWRREWGCYESPGKGRERKEKKRRLGSNRKRRKGRNASGHWEKAKGTARHMKKRLAVINLLLSNGINQRGAKVNSVCRPCPSLFPPPRSISGHPETAMEAMNPSPGRSRGHGAPAVVR